MSYTEAHPNLSDEYSKYSAHILNIKRKMRCEFMETCHIPIPLIMSN